MESYTYVAADCNFREGDQDRNNFLIMKWNSIVTPNDTVLILGNFIFGSLSFIKEILLKLNGSKEIGDYSKRRYGLEPEELKSLGFNYCWRDIIWEIDKELFIPVDMENLNYIQSRGFCAAAPKSLTHYNKLLENNTLCLSIDWWDSTPVRYDEIPQLFKNIEEFNKIEDGDVSGT